jgi:primosomal protein N' (replication factor Y)
VRDRFPQARIARLDRDEAHKKNVLVNTLRDFAAGKIDILIGTQMISKGIDIPKLSFVAVILADQGWGVPDFRALERSFQLLMQLKGRAGRRGQSSEILIQTFMPTHPLFTWLSADSAFETFAHEELKIRVGAHLPPYSRLALLTLTHKSEHQVLTDSENFTKRIQRFAESLNITIMGPTPAPIAKWKGVFRYHILLKAPLKGHLTTFLTAVLDECEKNSMKSKMKVDRDPYQFM